jgi:hypothetical protein
MMKSLSTFWKIAPTGLALVALVAVIVQTVKLRRLERALGRRPPAAKAVVDRSADLAALRARLYSLEGAVRRLVGLAMSAKGKAGGAPDPVLSAWVKNELKNLRDDVDAVLTKDALSTEEGRSRLKKLLRQARQEERQERRSRWHQVREHLRQERLNKLAEDYGIDTDTQQKLNTMLGDERQKLREIMRSFRSGDKDVATAVSEGRALLDATDKQAGAVLNDAQLKAFQDMRKDSRIYRFLRR